MTEDQARAALRAFVAVGELERWIAEQPWLAAPGGWVVPEPLQGWRFRVERAPGGVRIRAFMANGEPAAWIVPAVTGKPLNRESPRPSRAAKGGRVSLTEVSRLGRIAAGRRSGPS